MKQNVKETENNWRLQKNGKTVNKTRNPIIKYDKYDKVFLIRLLDDSYHYLVFMDPVNGCSKSKVLVKE